MMVSRAVRVALPILLGSFFLVPPAAAQGGAATSPHSVGLSPTELTAMRTLEAAARGTDRAAQDAALATAQSVASSAGARHALAHYQLEIARSRQDAQLAAQAVDALAASGLSSGGEMASLLLDQARRAYYAGEHVQAERLLARAVQLQPNDAAMLAEHAQMKSLLAGSLIRAGRQQEAQPVFAESVTMLRRAAELQQASGQAVPESWYRRALAISADRSLPQSVALSRDLVAAYPSPINWRDALFIYRQSAQGDTALELDIRRLQRAAQALNGERDYLEFAAAIQAADEASRDVSLAGEEKSVLDEGVSRNMLSASEPVVRQTLTANTRDYNAERTALARTRTEALAASTGTAARHAGDTHFGHGMYAEAAELYRAALQKGGEDPNLVNSRLGASLALAGQRAEAEAALRAVTGPRSDLAGFWLTWLARR